jgi:DTW domain-containing protein YfiP
MHPKEYKKERNGTGRMTQLQLTNSEIIVGVDFTQNKRVNELLANKNNTSFLLYPGEGSFNLSVRKSSETISVLGNNPQIFILDGTWPCAKKMIRMSKNLQALPRVSFDNQIQSKFIIKQQPAPLCLSTIESTYTVLNLLNTAEVEHCDTTDFLLPFEKMIKNQVDYLLNPSRQNYRPNTKGVVAPKNDYKKSNRRNIVFEEEN